MSQKLETILNGVIDAIKSANEKATSAYDTTAEVVRIEGDTAWVHIAGGVAETPVRRTIDCKAGDNVQVRIGGGDAWLTGNGTSPPTDDELASSAIDLSIIAENNAKNAYGKALSAEQEAEIARIRAREALNIAGNMNQYFWHTETGTDTGAHITEIPQDEFLADPTNGGGNLLARSNGIAVRDGLVELASFGSNGMKIGKEDEKHIEITASEFNVYDETGNVPFSVDTDDSAKTTNRGAWYEVGASVRRSSNIYLKGTFADGKLYVGVSTSGAPTYSNYIEPSAEGIVSITVDGVYFEANYIAESVLCLKATNQNSAARNVGYHFTESYYETTIKVNDEVLATRSEDIAVVDSVGAHVSSYSYAHTYGKVVSLVIGVYNTQSIIVGGQIYFGTLSSHLAPFGSVCICGVYASQPIIGSISSNGSIHIINTGTSAIASSSSNPVVLQATYIRQ